MTHSSLPFKCTDCQGKSVDEFGAVPGTEGYIWFDVEKRLIHLHYGISSWDSESSTAEAAGINKYILNEIFAKNPDKKFFLMIDFQRKGENTVPSQTALKLYAEVLKHNQMGYFIVYNANGTLATLARLAIVMSGTVDSVAIVKTEEEALSAYKEWIEKERSK